MPPKKAGLNWLLFSEECFEIFFENNDFTNGECIKLTISRLLGYIIISGAFVLKVPQIVKIVRNKSVQGISKYLFYVEVSYN